MEGRIKGNKMTEYRIKYEDRKLEYMEGQNLGMGFPYDPSKTTKGIPVPQSDYGRSLLRRAKSLIALDSEATFKIDVEK